MLIIVVILMIKLTKVCFKIWFARCANCSTICRRQIIGSNARTNFATPSATQNTSIRCNRMRQNFNFISTIWSRRQSRGPRRKRRSRNCLWAPWPMWSNASTSTSKVSGRNSLPYCRFLYNVLCLWSKLWKSFSRQKIWRVKIGMSMNNLEKLMRKSLSGWNKCRPSYKSI